MEEDLKKKAILSLGGAVLLPEGYEPSVRISHSTAGPGAGFGAIGFKFNGFSVKKPISHEKGEFELHQREDGSLFLTHGGEPFIDNIEVEPIVRHCPRQAFFTLDPRCMYHCAYCSSPLLDPKEDKHLTTERIMEMIHESMKTQEVDCISFTSGVVGSIDETVNRFVDVIKAVRNEYPDIPIGVEPYVSSEEHVRRLKEAGADEIKLNVECCNRELFEKICPDLDYDNIWLMLESAVKIFGKGKVISNIIYGFGESDDEIEDVLNRLCSMGVVPGVRALRINNYNRENLTKALGNTPEKTVAERALKIAKMQKQAMVRNGMDSMTSKTMCMGCTCCDIVPFVDF